MLIKNQATKTFFLPFSFASRVPEYRIQNTEAKMQLRSMTKKRGVSMMALLGLMLLLVDTSSVAARKLPKRPAVKPLKTFPRNNATPIPATGAGIAAPNGSELPKPLSVEPAEAIVASPPGSADSSGDSATATATATANAPAPAPASPAISPAAETKADDLGPAPMATPSGSSSSVDEDCEPDMIGFELITG